MVAGEKMADNPINLHDYSALQEIYVQDGVVLRPMENKDAKPILDILQADSSIRKRVTVASRLKTEQDVYEETESYKNDAGVIRYSLLEGDIVVGLISFWKDEGFFGQVPMPHTFGFGFFLHPQARGKGLATTSILSLMTVAQKSFRVDSFIAFCESDNPESQAVLKKVGMEITDVSYNEPTQGWSEQMWQKKVNHADDTSLQGKS